jgi:hypothetical protein
MNDGKRIRSRRDVFKVATRFRMPDFDFNKTTEIDPEFVEAYYYRAIAYLLLEEYDKSLSDVIKAQQLGYQIPLKFLDDLRKVTGGISV